MNLKNAKLLDGRTVNIFVENGKIEKITANEVPENAYDCEGRTVIPGLMDIHTHGCMGADTMECDFATMCDGWAKHGTTSVFPTTMTMDIDSIRAVDQADTDVPGAKILGFHMEGPYINYNKRGAQNGKFVKEADFEEFKTLKNMKVITIAPECGNNMEFIRKTAGLTKMQMGHSEIDYNTALEAIDNGVTCLTHAYNAMPAFASRDTGPIGAAYERHIYAEIIVDGLHVSKEAVLAVYRSLGPDRMILISDSLRATGLEDGEYMFGGQPIFVKDGVARVAEGNLAGSTSYLYDCVRTAYRFGIPFADVVRMASETPATYMGISGKGKLACGYDADILVINDNLEIEKVMIEGEFYNG